MNKKTELRFSEDRKSVVVVFANEKTSLDYTNKIDAMAAIVDMVKSSKITTQEAEHFLETIAEEENLPLTNHDINVKVIRINLSSFKNELGSPADVSNFLRFVAGVIVSEIEDMKDSRDFLEKPTSFKMCKDHGHIFVHNKGLYSKPILNKIQGFTIVSLMREKNEISEEEAKLLNKQIEKSELPIGSSQGSTIFPN